MLIDTLVQILEQDKISVWTLEDAVEMCRILEEIAPEFGCHVALTGGCLYKDGRRKDADVLFYRIRQKPVIDEAGLIARIQLMGFEIIKRSGWVLKVKWNNKPVDMFFPEEQVVDIDNKCLDDQYPGGGICPKCNGKRFYDPEKMVWYHAPIPDETDEKRFLPQFQSFGATVEESFGSVDQEPWKESLNRFTNTLNDKINNLIVENLEITKDRK